ncbi:MAG: hypothetical protein ACKOAU_19255, partial [Pirellula sp.]
DAHPRAVAVIERQQDRFPLFEQLGNRSRLTICVCKNKVLRDGLTELLIDPNALHRLWYRQIGGADPIVDCKKNYQEKANAP